ncbi:MAG: hypothetical protein Q9187_004108, partial [Circinaria calcarea]
MTSPYTEPDLCRSVEVQTRLASLKGWLESLSAVQGYNVGKLSVELIIFARLFEFMGGGITVAYILLYALLADAVPKETRASVFYTMEAIILLARAGAMGLCGTLLKKIPYALGPLTVLVYALNVPILLLSSSAATRVKLKQDVAISTAALSAEGIGSETPTEPNTTERLIDDRSDDKMSMVKYCKRILVSAYKEYLGRAVFRLSFLICAIKIVGLDVQLIQTQWTIKRYDWNFSAAAYINAYMTLVCMCVLAGLPLLSSYLLTKLGSTRKMEIRLLQLSLSLRVAGTLAMGLSPNKTLFLVSAGVQALSAGTYNTFKSLMTSFTSANQVAELYAVIAMVESMARIIDGQMWANVLIVSLRLGGVA